MTKSESDRISRHPHDDPELDRYEAQTADEMLAEVAAARKAGTLRRGGVNAVLTDPVTLDAKVAAVFEQESAREAQAETDEKRRAGRAVEPLIPVTIRMPAPMIAALRAEAERQGVRGYQTLLKQWVEERLSGEKFVSARQVAAVLRPLQQLIEVEDSPSLPQRLGS
jgi:predicted DNA binding CopG/RHH family protein